RYVTGGCRFWFVSHSRREGRQASDFAITPRFQTFSCALILSHRWHPMKTHLIKFTTQSIKNFRDILAGFIITAILFNMLPKARGADLFWQDNATSPATAGSGTWTTVSFSGIGAWSTSQTSNTFDPWTDGSFAIFLGSAGGLVTLGSPITAAGINFDSGANAFIINTNGNQLAINGAGIVNNS